MARTALPRFRVDVSLVLELAATDEDHADAIAVGLASLIEHRAASTVRNAGSRTARVVPGTRTLGTASAV